MYQFRRAAAAVVLMALPSLAVAQTSQRSEITGVVTDASDALIVGAHVTLAGPGLPGGSIVALTDTRGEYRFRDLLPTEYSVTITASGFDSVVRRGIQLPVETTFAIDVRLDVSGMSETVHVDAMPPLVDVRTAASPTVLPQAMLHDLPTNRSLPELLNLAPGIGIGILYNDVQGSSIAYGGTQGSNGVTVDGVSIVESFFGDARVSLNYDWVDHVQVVALGAAADYGGTTGATANGVLRSGTDRFSAFGNYLWERPGWNSDNTASLPNGWRNLHKSLPLTTWYDTSGQLGGPLIPKRVWFFGGVQYLHHVYAPPGLVDGNTDGRKLQSLVKVDAAPASPVRLQGFFTHGAADTDGYGAGVPGSGPHLATSQMMTVHNNVWNARATWTPGSATLVEVRTSGFREDEDHEPRPPFTRAGPPYVRDDGTGLSSGAASYSELHQRSITASGSAAHDFTAFGQLHEFKTGVEFEHAPTESINGYSGGRFYVAFNGVLQTVDYWNGTDSRLTNRRTTLFAEDRWRMTDRVTLELGLRGDLNQGAVPVLGQVFASSPLGPRAGLAWDVTKNHRTVVRAHYGRYHDQLFSALYSRKDASAFNPRTRYQIVDGQLGPLQTSDVPPQDVVISSDIAQPHVDQWTGSVDREVGRDLAITLQYIRRHFGSFIGYVDPNLATYPLVTVHDPGPDNVSGTADDGGEFQVAQVLSFGDRAWELTNPSAAWRHYDALQVIAGKRQGHSWQMQASYTWSRSASTVDNLDHTNLAQGTLSPLAGVGGNLNVARQGAGEPTFGFNEAKALASWRAPWWGGFLVSTVGRWQTGVRWNRIFFSPLPGYPLINAEPVGSHVGPSIRTIDLRAEKTFALQAPRIRVGVMMDAFNVTNGAAPLSISGISGPLYGLPSVLIPPRQLRAGIRVEF